jgi:hypothetical protein
VWDLPALTFHNLMAQIEKYRRDEEAAHREH